MRKTSINSSKRTPRKWSQNKSGKKSQAASSTSTSILKPKSILKQPYLDAQEFRHQDRRQSSHKKHVKPNPNPKSKYKPKYKYKAKMYQTIQPMEQNRYQYYGNYSTLDQGMESPTKKKQAKHSNSNIRIEDQDYSQQDYLGSRPNVSSIQGSPRKGIRKASSKKNSHEKDNSNRKHNHRQQQPQAKLLGKDKSSAKNMKSQGSSDMIKQICLQKMDREEANRFLDRYEKTLQSRLAQMKQKWEQLQILQKSMINWHNINSEQGLPSTLSLQNEFYIKKISQLQSQLSKKEKELKQSKQRRQKNDEWGKQEILRNNEILKEENKLLEKQNKVLKNKLKQFGIL